MSTWRRVAIEKMPELRHLVEQSDTVGMLWIDLFGEFEKAHRDPVDESLIRRIYDYAWWSVSDPGSDAASAAICGFFEDLPTHSQIRRSMPQFMSRDEFLGMRDVFKYHLDPKEHEEFVESFLQRRNRIDGAALKGA